MAKLNLLNIGITDKTDHYLIRSIRIVNLFSWLTIFGLIFGATNIIFLKSDYPIIPEICFLILGILAVNFNHWKKYNFASFLTILNINIAVFFINEFYAFETGTFLFYFPLIICISLLYNPGSNNKSVIYYYILSITFFVISFLFDFPIIKNKNISEESNEILFNYNIVFCISISALLIYLLLKLINNQNKELVELLKKEKQNLSEKEILLAEIHHRVKNNMAIISGLLNLQINATTNEDAKKILEENRVRILSMSKVHDKLYKKTDFTKIEFSEYASELVDEILKSRAELKNISITKQLDSCEISVSKAIPIGLILNEMLTNSFKHAFKNIANPQLTISLKLNGNKIQLLVKDNGKGYSNNFTPNTDSLGMSLMLSLSDQIDGKIDFYNENGAVAKLEFNTTL